MWRPLRKCPRVFHMPSRTRYAFQGFPSLKYSLPVSEFLIQPVAWFLPWHRVGGPQMLTHFVPDPVRTLLRRTAAPSAFVPSSCEMNIGGTRPFGLEQQTGAGCSAVRTCTPESRTAPVAHSGCSSSFSLRGQRQPADDSTRPFQRFSRLSATENHKVVRAVHDARFQLPPDQLASPRSRSHPDKTDRSSSPLVNYPPDRTGARWLS